MRSHKLMAVLLNFSKAFDEVSHRRLLHKLDHYRDKCEVLIVTMKQKNLIEAECTMHGQPLKTVGHSVSNQPEVYTRPSQIFTQKLPYALECVLSIHTEFQLSILYTC